MRMRKQLSEGRHQIAMFLHNENTPEGNSLSPARSTSPTRGEHGGSSSPTGGGGGGGIGVGSVSAANSSSAAAPAITNDTILATAVVCAIITVVFLLTSEEMEDEQKIVPQRAAAPIHRAQWKEHKKQQDLLKKQKKYGTKGGPQSKPPPSHTDVTPFAPYHPHHVGWSKHILADNTPAEAGEKGDCVAWRQTARCTADGPREAWFDLHCDQTVAKGRGSGYCECAGGVRKAKFGCGYHAPFTCSSACADDSAIIGQGAEGGEDLEEDQRVDEREDVDDIVTDDWEGGAGAGPFHAATSQPLWAADDSQRSTSSRALVKSTAKKPNSKLCVGWKQTIGCSPFGAIEEGFDRSCKSLILNGMSGYCQCAHSQVGRGPGVGCAHKPFNCAEECDPSTASSSLVPQTTVSSATPDDGDVVTSYNAKNDNIRYHVSSLLNEKYFDLVEEKIRRHRVESETTATVEQQHLEAIANHRKASADFMARVGGRIDDDSSEVNSGIKSKFVLAPGESAHLFSKEGIERFDADLSEKIKAAKTTRDPDPPELDPGGGQTDEDADRKKGQAPWWDDDLPGTPQKSRRSMQLQNSVNAKRQLWIKESEMRQREENGRQRRRPIRARPNAARIKGQQNEERIQLNPNQKERDPRNVIAADPIPKQRGEGGGDRDSPLRKMRLWKNADEPNEEVEKNAAANEADGLKRREQGGEQDQDRPTRKPLKEEQFGLGLEENADQGEAAQAEQQGEGEEGRRRLSPEEREAERARFDSIQKRAMERLGKKPRLHGDNDEKGAGDTRPTGRRGDAKLRSRRY